jgi:hypothetical protein
MQAADKRAAPPYNGHLMFCVAAAPRETLRKMHFLL